MAKQIKRKADVVIEYTDDASGAPDMPIKLDKSPKKPKEKFIPTAKMKSAKLRFYNNCPDKFISQLTDDMPVTCLSVEETVVPMVEYMRRVSILEFDEWVRIDGFWQWFVRDDNDEEVLRNELSKQSLKALKEILDMDSRNDAGEIDPKVINLQLRAIQLIMNKPTHNGTIINKTVTNNRLQVTGIPKAIAKLPESILRRDLKKMQQLNSPSKRGRKENERID